MSILLAGVLTGLIFAAVIYLCLFLVSLMDQDRPAEAARFALVMTGAIALFMIGAAALLLVFVALIPWIWSSVQ